MHKIQLDNPVGTENPLKNLQLQTLIFHLSDNNKLSLS